MSHYDAVVLAGGEGSRLGGVSKADVLVAGSPLLDHALSAVAGARRRIVVGPGELARPGVPTTLEDPPFGGPVAGIDAGLAWLGAGGPPIVVILACDVPGAGPLVHRLLAAAADDPASDGAVAVDVDGHRQLLVGVYRRASLTAALAALRTDGGVHGMAVKRLVARLRLTEVADPDGLAADADTWQDVTALDAAIEGRHG